MQRRINKENECDQVRSMERSTTDWQVCAPRLCDRAQHLLTTGLWSDCSFSVGIPPYQQVFRSHKLILSMASPVFEAMFFGDITTHSDTPVEIVDVNPDAFTALLNYVYTDRVNLSAFDQACEVCYAAKKYMLPQLVEQCTQFMFKDLKPRNAARALEFAKLFEEPKMMERCMQILCTQTSEVLAENTMEEMELTTLKAILSQDMLSVKSEMELFNAALRWAKRECERRSLEPTPEAQRAALGDALFLVRFLALTSKQFASGPAVSGVLTQDESFAILMHLSSPGKWPLPDTVQGCSANNRQPPKIDAGTEIWHTGERPQKYYCRRIFLTPDQPCVNNSILDCSVTFSVDKNICILGVEIPSQLPLEYEQANGYNELLYAHMLDADGSRLTYTHLSSRVMWNDVIEILFNRPIHIKRNKVYRIVVVLNKAGHYPLGACTSRVTIDGVTFSFNTGQANETMRDGLIRTIIYSVDENYKGPS